MHEAFNVNSVLQWTFCKSQLRTKNRQEDVQTGAPSGFDDSQSYAIGSDLDPSRFASETSLLTTFQVEL